MPARFGLGGSRVGILSKVNDLYGLVSATFRRVEAVETFERVAVEDLKRQILGIEKRMDELFGVLGAMAAANRELVHRTSTELFTQTREAIDRVHGVALSVQMVRSDLERLAGTVATMGETVQGIKGAAERVGGDVRGLQDRTSEVAKSVEAAAEAQRGVGADFSATFGAFSSTFADFARRVDKATQFDLKDDLYDIKEMVAGRTVKPVTLQFDAEKPLAFDSPDHLVPRGTRNDNTRHPRFVRRAEQVLSEIRHLDIGCAGGGLVWDFSFAGHLSVGVEGSDFSRKEGRAEWRTIPDRLFTADVTHPFEVRDAAGERILFNLVTAWELFEHIPTDLVGDTIRNLAANMAPGALLACSIATFVDWDPATGAVFHQTVKPREWWVERFAELGMRPREDVFSHADYVRGSGNPRSHDWDAIQNPDLGFHLTLEYQP